MGSQHILWALLPKSASLLGPSQTFFQGFPQWASDEGAEAFWTFQQGLQHRVCARARVCVCVE